MSIYKSVLVILGSIWLVASILLVDKFLADSGISMTWRIFVASLVASGAMFIIVMIATIQKNIVVRLREIAKNIIKRQTDTIKKTMIDHSRRTESRTAEIIAESSLPLMAAVTCLDPNLFEKSDGCRPVSEGSPSLAEGDMVLEKTGGQPNSGARKRQSALPETAGRMMVCSWPGRLVGNKILEILADGLTDGGAEYVGVDKLSDSVVGGASALLINFPDYIFLRDDGTELALAAMRQIDDLRAWRWSGVKLVWVVHNTEPHDLAPGKRALWASYSNALGTIVHGFMTLSPATRQPVVEAHPILGQRPFGFFRHPAYPKRTHDAGSVVAARKALGVMPGQRLLGALGMIGEYKGLEELIGAFASFENSNVRLLIAGPLRPNSGIEKIEKLAAQDSRIIVSPGLMSDEEFSLKTAACDCLAAPYTKSLHSGTVMYAMSANRRILTPDTPFARDVADLVGKGWVHCYQGRLDQTCLQKFLDESDPMESPKLDQFSPANSAAGVIDLVSRLSRC